MTAAAALTQILAREYPSWQAHNLRLVGQGLENWVFRADTAPFGPVAIRVPRERIYHNDNDSDLEARLLLQQEAALADHMATSGVPVPAALALHLSEELDFLASAFVESDGSMPDPREMGRLTRAIHDCPVPVIRPVAQGPGALAETLAERLIRRTRTVERLAGVRLPLPGPAEVAAALTWPGARRRLLHMDMRPANLLTRQGAIVAVLDWTNALVGDPGLELARIAEYGHLDHAFLEGYSDPDWPGRIPPVADLLYRLDTAVMLAVVFLSESPDPEAAERQLQRVDSLVARLHANW